MYCCEAENSLATCLLSTSVKGSGIGSPPVGLACPPRHASRNSDLGRPTWVFRASSAGTSWVPLILRAALRVPAKSGLRGAGRIERAGRQAGGRIGVVVARRRDVVGGVRMKDGG